MSCTNAKRAGSKNHREKEDNMKSIGKSIFGIAAVAATLGLAVPSANAQEAKFTLPMEAHWGKAVLEPGDYRVKFPNAVDPTPVLRLTGNGQTVNILLQSRSAGRDASGTGKLSLVDLNGSYVVESISNPFDQQTFLFPMRKHHEWANNAGTASGAAKIAVEIGKVR
jgi:hypothetical protein